jgi:hypothetical protein
VGVSEARRVVVALRVEDALWVLVTVGVRVDVPVLVCVAEVVAVVVAVRVDVLVRVAVAWVVAAGEITRALREPVPGALTPAHGFINKIERNANTIKV